MQKRVNIKLQFLQQPLLCIVLMLSDFPAFYSRPPQKHFMLMLMKMYLLNRVPKHDCLTYISATQCVARYHV